MLSREAVTTDGVDGECNELAVACVNADVDFCSVLVSLQAVSENTAAEIKIADRKDDLRIKGVGLFTILVRYWLIFIILARDNRCSNDKSSDIETGFIWRSTIISLRKIFVVKNTA